MSSSQFMALNNAFQALQQQAAAASQNSSGSSQNASGRPVIERGASWSYNETRILLSLWGQDMVQRQLTNSKRTRHVWEKIAERIREHGFDRTADQVRTRVFNMIAEYRRILKNPTPERKKKCIFFDALHKIYQAKDTNGVKAALNNYEEDYNLDPIDFTNSDENNDGNGDGTFDGEDNSGNESEVFSYAMSPSQAMPNGMGVSINGGNGGNNSGPDNDDSDMDAPIHNNHTIDDVPNPAKRLRSDSNLSSIQQQNMYHSFDTSSSALLIDRMFAHLAKETEVMREWVHLERERLSQEVTRRKEENEREERREKVFLQTLTRMQEQMFSYLSKHHQNNHHNPTRINNQNQNHSSQTPALSSQSSPCNNGLLHPDDGLNDSCVPNDIIE